MAHFQIGKLVVTTRALALLAEHYVLPEDLLARHAVCDWGDCGVDAIMYNRKALKDGSRIQSIYLLPGDTRVWVVTDSKDGEGVRETTTILLPQEY